MPRIAGCCFDFDIGADRGVALGVNKADGCLDVVGASARRGPAHATVSAQGAALKAGACPAPSDIALNATAAS